jgi:hypothetical protein
MGQKARGTYLPYTYALQHWLWRRAPRIPGSVVVDLGRCMDKVLSTDGDNASCMVEPGVSYFKLYEDVQKRKLPLWIDCPDLGGGSNLDNAIDRGVGYTSYSDYFAN